jgi:hypothetical protein
LSRRRSVSRCTCIFLVGLPISGCSQPQRPFRRPHTKPLLEVLPMVRAPLVRRFVRSARLGQYRAEPAQQADVDKPSTTVPPPSEGFFKPLPGGFGPLAGLFEPWSSVAPPKGSSVKRFAGVAVPDESSIEPAASGSLHVRSVLVGLNVRLSSLAAMLVPFWGRRERSGVSAAFNCQIE